MIFKPALTAAFLVSLSVLLSSCGDVPHDNPMDPNSQAPSCTAPPTVSAITPTSGPSGQLATITGSNLSDITVVLFGDTYGTITSRSDTQASVIVPTHSSGSVSVTVSNTCGAAASTPSFTYN